MVLGGETMKARCLVSFFTNHVGGTKDDVIEIENQSLYDDLLKSGYIEAVESQPTQERENISSDPTQLKAKKSRASKVVDSYENQ
jgi:hypothetical protein